MVDFFGIITGMASGIGQTASNMFTGNFLGAIGSTNAVFIGFIFIVFVFVMRKAMSTIINLAIVGVASALFPFALGYLGFAVPITVQTLIFFVVLGIGAYIIFVIGKYALKLFSSEEKIKTR